MIRWIYLEYQTNSSPVRTLWSDRGSLLTLREAVSQNRWHGRSTGFTIDIQVFYEPNQRVDHDCKSSSPVNIAYNEHYTDQFRGRGLQVS